MKPPWIVERIGPGLYQMHEKWTSPEPPPESAIGPLGQYTLYAQTSLVSFYMVTGTDNATASVEKPE